MGGEIIKNTLIVGVIVTAIFIGYNVLFKGAEEEGALAVVRGRTDEAPKAAVEFLKTLNDLEKIKLETGLFEEDVYKNLEDFNVLLVPESRGRSNPFAPL